MWQILPYAFAQGALFLFPENCCDTLELHLPSNYTNPNIPTTFHFLDAKEVIERYCIDKECSDEVLNPPGYFVTPDGMKDFDPASGNHLFRVFQSNLAFENQFEQWYSSFFSRDSAKSTDDAIKKKLAENTERLDEYMDKFELWAFYIDPVAKIVMLILDYDCGSAKVVIIDETSDSIIEGASLTCASSSSKLQGWVIAVIIVALITVSLIIGFLVKKECLSKTELNENFL